MRFQGEDLIGNGHCLVCGARLMAGDTCFDCWNPLETKRERFQRVMGTQKSLFEKDMSKLEPREGEDFYYQEEVIAEVCGTGRIVVFADEVSDSDGE